MCAIVGTADVLYCSKMLTPSSLHASVVAQPDSNQKVSISISLHNYCFRVEPELLKLNRLLFYIP